MASVSEAEVAGDLDTKKERVVGKLQRRDDDRMEELIKRKQEKEISAVRSETGDFFIENFNNSRESIIAKLEMSHEVGKEKLTDHFDGLLIDVQKLQRFLTESTMFLNSYRVQQSQEIIFQLEMSVQEARDKYMPKKKFAFKSKKKTGEVKEKAAAKPDISKKNLNIDMTECRFHDIKDENLTKFPSDLNQKDVALSHLSGCTVKLKGSPSAIHISHMKDCTVYSGPVSGSIFVDDCTSSTLVLPCQQLRIHNTKSSDFYIHVTSKAIIEDCNEVRFAPYSWNYDGLAEHYELSGLDQKRNTWDDVDDFNWLASDMPSPNWRTIPETERKDFGME